MSPTNLKYTPSQDRRVVNARLDQSQKHLVDPEGLEPSTPTMPLWCAPNCATGPRDRIVWRDWLVELRGFEPLTSTVRL